MALNLYCRRNGFFFFKILHFDEFRWLKKLCKEVDLLMVGFFKDLSKKFVHFFYDLVLITQDLLMKFYLLLEYCIGFAQHFLVCFGFDMIQIWEVLE
jgi:hypothetical protein